MDNVEHNSTLTTPDTQTPLLPVTSYTTRANCQATSREQKESHVETIPKSELFGYLLVSLSALAFASNVICVRIAETEYSMTPYQVVFILSIVITTLATIHLTVFTSPSLPSLLRSLSVHQWRIIIIRGIAGGLTCIFLYSAVDYIPSGDADAIYFMSPAIVLFLSHLFINEKACMTDIILATISISGAILVSVSTSTSTTSLISYHKRLLGSLFAIAGALFNSAGLVLVRSIVSNTHFMLLVLSLGVCSIPLTLALGGIVTPAQIRNDWRGPVAALGCALFAFIAQTLMHWGLKFTRAGTGSLVRNLEVPLVYLLAVVILNERPTLVRIFGSMLVVGSAFTIGLRQMVRSSSAS